MIMNFAVFLGFERRKKRESNFPLCKALFFSDVMKGLGEEMWGL
jgi:hypothetical protein